MLFDHCRAQVDTVVGDVVHMDLPMLCKGNGEKDEDKKGKCKGKANAKATEYFAGYAPLVDARTIGKAPTFTGEHQDRPEWSFQLTAHVGSANPKSIEALRWAAMWED